MLKETLTVLGIGFGVVFVGLICLIGIIYLMSFFVRLSQHELRAHKPEQEEVVPVTHSLAPVSAPALTGEKRRELVAAVSAAIAESIGEDVSGIRIRSIRRVGGETELSPEQRRELIAVISAAIAEQMGADVSGIRIRSIRRAA